MDEYYWVLARRECSLHMTSCLNKEMRMSKELTKRLMLTGPQPRVLDSASAHAFDHVDTFVGDLDESSRDDL